MSIATASSSTQTSIGKDEHTPLLENNGSTNSTQDENETTIPTNANELPTSHLLTIMSSTYLGIFLAALDGTMVATLTASICASYNSMTLLAWLASSYFIANSVLQPLSGKLTDIYGRRAGLIFSNIFFALGNLISGLAVNPAMIILGRTVAGLGGGGLNAIPLFIASDLVPLRKRGVWQGFNNICFGLGSGLGGVFGGWMNDVLNWRWAFLVLVPVTVLSGVLVALFIQDHEADTKLEQVAEKWKRIDVAGSLLLTATIVLLCVGLNSGGNTVPWLHPLVTTTLSMSALTLAVFVWVERNVATEPVIPISLLCNTTVAAGCLTNWFLTMTQIALTFYAPIFFQVQGHDAFEAGLRLIPTSVGAGFGSILVGYTIRVTGTYRKLNIIVQLLFLTPLALTAALFNLNTSTWLPIILFFLTGFAYAGMLTITVTALIASVDHELHALVTGASYAFRGTGSTIGIAICSLVFQNRLKHVLWEKFQFDHDAERIVHRLRGSLEEISHLQRDMAEDARDAYMEALTSVFWTLSALALVGAVASLFMGQHALHQDLARRRA